MNRFLARILNKELNSLDTTRVWVNVDCFCRCCGNCWGRSTSHFVYIIEQKSWKESWFMYGK
ncbi:unnamed protein product [Meloidogyne enterolobii]|uniref:Uncharacterized protein n=1 Tax=Meloidogyne enterolobii TaxID=390850 RepID=A0ACB1AV44_MELEN